MLLPAVVHAQETKPTKAPDIQGFSFLRSETFTGGGKTNTLKIYRNERFAKALGLAAGKTDIAAEFVLVPGGTFMMGIHVSRRPKNEGPQHQVNVKPFLLARTELTQGVWERVMNSNPSKFKGAKRPVEQVSWSDAISFCWETGVRLPSEAEWEYACRAGTVSAFAFGATITTEQVNYDGTNLAGLIGGNTKGTNRKRTTDVGSLAANAFGLSDVHGNVWEWCQDAWHDNYEGAPNDGSVWRSGADVSKRVWRGGSWVDASEDCRSGLRLRSEPDYRVNYLGFRPAFSLPK